MNAPEGVLQRCTDSCSFVHVDLQQFIYAKRIVLRCDTCGRLWPLYHQWIHRLDPQPSDTPSSPDATASPEDLVASSSFLRSWWWVGPVVVFLIALAIAFRFVA